MGELESTDGAGGVVAASAGVIETVVTYGIVVAQLAAAGLKLRGLSERVRWTYSYVEGCSKSTDRLAEQMAALAVDVDTISEHRTAAKVMRQVLEDAEAMGTAMEDLASLFEQTSDAHRADYGPVADAARSMPVPMADAEFYSNR